MQVHNAFLYISLPSLRMHECLKETRNATKFEITRINIKTHVSVFGAVADVDGGEGEGNGNMVLVRNTLFTLPPPLHTLPPSRLLLPIACSQISFVRKPVYDEQK